MFVLNHNRYLSDRTPLVQAHGVWEVFLRTPFFLLTRVKYEQKTTLFLCQETYGHKLTNLFSFYPNFLRPFLPVHLFYSYNLKKKITHAVFGLSFSDPS